LFGGSKLVYVLTRNTYGQVIIGIRNERQLEMSRQKKSTKPVREIQFYVIEITDWKHFYSLALNDNDSLKDLFGPSLYREHKSLALSGVFLEPKKIVGKDLQIKLFGSRDISVVLNKPEDYPRASVKAVGGLTVRGKTRVYYGSLPMDMYILIANMLTAEKIKYITMMGDALFRGKADIHSIDFEEEYDQEDLE
jgi:hypothetical protein